MVASEGRGRDQKRVPATVPSEPVEARAPLDPKPIALPIDTGVVGDPRTSDGSERPSITEIGNPE